MRRPATDGRKCVTPSVEAWARCAAPKASLDVYVRQARQVLSKGRIVAFLSWVEPEILEHDDLTRLHRLYSRLNFGTRRFVCLNDGSTKEFG